MIAVMPEDGRPIAPATLALFDCSGAIVALGKVAEWASTRATDHPGGDDLTALATYTRAWAIRLGVEIADALAADVDAAGVLGAHG